MGEVYPEVPRPTSNETAQRDPWAGFVPVRSGGSARLVWPAGPLAGILVGVKRPLDRGVLLVFEGIDGVGKSTQIGAVAGALRADGVDVVTSKEPTDGPHGKRLRASATTGRLDPAAELELFVADRREHVAQLILPALARGAVVILDRYYFSTAAYQGARGLSWESILARNEEFAPEPDLLVWLDLPPESSMERIRARGDAANEFERANLLEASRRIFASISKPYLRRIDATLPVGVIRDAVVADVRREMASRAAQMAGTKQSGG